MERCEIKDRIENLKQTRIEWLEALKGFDAAEEILKNLDKKRGLMKKEDIMSYAQKIRLLLRGDKDEVCFSNDNRRRALYWSKGGAISTECTARDYQQPLMKASKLKKLGTITTYHSYGLSINDVAPSIDEAIWQCPKDWLDRVVGFEFSYKNSNPRIEACYNPDLDLHVLETTYYEGELPKKVADEPLTW